ncbi:MAG: PIN domain-containing protein [Chloroflexi bacterium]|nr:PIN domain-containing protein [Chloroflexota bacterium]
MGTLTLPSTGPIYLDTSGFIYSVERIEPYRALLEPMWRQAQTGRFAIVSSELVVLETLVKPLRDADLIVETLFRSLFDASEVNLIPTTRALWEEAAFLRAETGLKTPDALHAATALHTGCTLFVTNDDDFHRVEGLPIVVLDDLA